MMTQVGSIGILTILNVVGAVIGLASSVVVAYFFGTGRALEVYFAASMLQGLVAKLTQTGQLGEVFLPIYHKIKHTRGIEEARRAFAVIINWMALFAIVVTLGLWLLVPILVRIMIPGFTSEDQGLGVKMFYCLLPLLCIQVVQSLSGTLAHAERRFAWPGTIGICSRVAILVAICGLAYRLGAWAMVAALWIGQGVGLLGCVFMLYRMGYRHRLCLRQEGFSPWSVFNKLFVTSGYVGATQVYAIALSAGLSLLPQGTYAVFGYVQRLYARTNGIFLRPVSVVFFTHFSEALARGAKSVKSLAQSALSRSLGICTLAIVAVVVAGQPLLSGLWGGKRFGPEHLELASRLLVVFYVLLLASAIGQIARKTAMSLGLVAWQYGAASLVQIMSAVCAWLLIARFGIPGVVGTVVFNCVALAAASLLVLFLRGRDLLTFYPLANVGRWLVAALVGLGIGLAIKSIVPDAGWTTGRLGQLLLAALLGGSAGLGCLAAAWMMRNTAGWLAAAGMGSKKD